MRREILKNWNIQPARSASQVVPLNEDSLTLSERLRGGGSSASARLYGQPVDLPNPRSICAAEPQAHSSSGFTTILALDADGQQ